MPVGGIRLGLGVALKHTARAWSGGQEPAPRVTIEDRAVKAAVPDGSRFRSHEPFLVQDPVISASASLLPARTLGHAGWPHDPGAIARGDRGSFRPRTPPLRADAIPSGQSTLPRLAALLRSVGVSISKRQLQRLPTDKQEEFVAEAQDVLRAGLETSPDVSVDDTGARHAGKNGFCT